MNRTVQLKGKRDQWVTIVGGILGLAKDEEIAEDAYRLSRPKEVLLGVPYEDLDAIRATSGKEATHEFSSGDLDDDYVRRLSTFGEVKTPPPDLYALFRLAEANQVPVRPIDLGDEAYTDAYTKNVGMFEVLRSNRNQRRLPEREIRAASAEEFAQRWDEAMYPTKGLRKVQALREEEMAAAIEKTIVPQFLALVPLARMPGIVAALRRAGWDDA